MTTYDEDLGIDGSATLAAVELLTVNQAMLMFGAAGLFPDGGVTMEELLTLVGDAGLSLTLADDFIASPCRYYYVAAENRILTVEC